MAYRWQSALKIPQTQYLLVGLSLGFLGFIRSLGLRWITLICGVLIVGVAIAAWFIQLESRQSQPTPRSTNLLDPATFEEQLDFWNPQIPDASQSIWQAIQQQAEATRQVALQIAQKEPSFTVDLLETLHSVLDLVEHLAQTLRELPTVKSSHYRNSMQQQMQVGQTRLEQTLQQVQEIHDQIVLERMYQQLPYSTASSVISSRLQQLVAKNERFTL
jgi:hypothetical protein